MAIQPTVAAPPSTQDVASNLLAVMAALSGKLTDYNQGSQIRTLAETIGSVVEQQGAWSQALGFQFMIYGAMAAFGITPYPAFPALGEVTFTTSVGSPFPAEQNVSIPEGTIMQTQGGAQFRTTAATTLISGASAVNVGIESVTGGVEGNVPALAINRIVTGLTYPLNVFNANATTGGTDIEQPSQTLARFTGTVQSIGLSSPIAIANAAIGVVSTSTNEVVRYSTCYEPWVAAGSGPGSGQAGFELYIDNGLGTASSGLCDTVAAVLDGNVGLNQNGYRDAGVPYAVIAVSGQPVYVGVSGFVTSQTTTGIVSGLIAQAVSGYFSLQFGAPAQQAVLAQTVGNAVLGLMTTLSVALYASGSGTPVEFVDSATSGRIILGGVNMDLA